MIRFSFFFNVTFVQSTTCFCFRGLRLGEIYVYEVHYFDMGAIQKSNRPTSMWLDSLT